MGAVRGPMSTPLTCKHKGQEQNLREGMSKSIGRCCGKKVKPVLLPGIFLVKARVHVITKSDSGFDHQIPNA